MQQTSASQSRTAERINKLSWNPVNLLPTLLAAAIAGVGSGVICVVLRLGLRFLQWIITGRSGLLADAASHSPLWRRTLTPVVGALIATLILKGGQRFSRSNRFHDYVDAVRFRQGQMPFSPTLWRTLSSAFSVASGAAIGREGSMIQFAASVISALGEPWASQTLPLRRIVSFGAAAAVAAVYQAPIAGAFFALEIVLGTEAFSRAGLIEIPGLLVAAEAGAIVSRLLVGGDLLFAVPRVVHFEWRDGLPILISSVVIAALGPLYFYIIRSLRVLKRWPLPMVWSGAIVGLLSCLEPEVWGNGDSAVLGIVSGRLTIETAAIILLLRLCATAACVGSGVVGGVFTPTVFAGGALGLFCGSAMQIAFPHISGITGYSVLGIACLLASVTHAPFMAAFMTVELTGTTRWLPLLLCCTLWCRQIATRVSSHALYAVATPDPSKAVSASEELDTTHDAGPSSSTTIHSSQPN